MQDKNMQEDIFQKFIDRVRAERTPEEAERFFADLTKFGAAELYFTIMTELTEEDMRAIEQISDEKEAQEEMKKKFVERTGVAPEEFVTKLRDRVAQEYLNPSQTPA